MHGEEIVNLVKSKRTEGRTLKKISDDLLLSISTVQYILKRKDKTSHRKTGPKRKIEKKHELSIKRYINQKLIEGEKVTSTKITYDLDLPCSCETVRRYLNRKEYKFRKIPKTIALQVKHKENRVEIVKEWMKKNINWSKVIFSDEKRFSRDGPDNFSSFIPKYSKFTRQRHQSNGQGIMIWGMLHPDGMVYLKEMIGKQNSIKYEEVLRGFAVPIIEGKYNKDYLLQQDNCSIHVSSHMKEYFSNSEIKLLSWPSCSPDLNLMEVVWSMLSNHIYSSKQPKNIPELRTKIFAAASFLNEHRTDDLCNLYASCVENMCKILELRGNIINK